MMNEALIKACKMVGGQAAMARLLGIKPPSVNEWVKTRVPFEHVIKIEQITNGAVSCEDLRPDVDWAYLRATDCPVLDPYNVAA